MKIAFVFPPIWPAQVDGSLQIWNREVATRLAQANDVTVYCGRFPSEPLRDSVGRVRYRAVSIRFDNRLQKRYEFIRRLFRVKRPLFATDYWYSCYALTVALSLRKDGCDVVHVYNYPQFVRIIKRFNPKTRVVLNMHGEWLAQIPFTALDLRLPEIDAIVSCSDLVTRSTAAKFPASASRCKTVPMGIAPESFTFDPVARGRNPNGSKKLLYVGRISPEKGVHDLLDAFELILRKYPDSTLTIVGAEGVAPREYIVDLCLGPSLIEKLAPFYEGGYLSKLQSRLSPEAAKKVTFAGLVSHAEVAKFYREADVYVSPSLYESFGMSIIEAMACGVPVVAAKGGAVSDLISDQRNGLLVEPADPEALSRAVSTLFDDPSLGDSLVPAAREMVQKQFSWETISTSLMEIYGAVGAARHGSFEAKGPIEENRSPRVSAGTLR